MSKPLDSVKTFCDISVNTDQIVMGFEADTPFKLKQHANRSTLRTKIWLKSIDQLLVTNFLTRSLSHTMGMLLSFFFKFYANLTSNKGNIRESLP